MYVVFVGKDKFWWEQQGTGGENGDVIQKQ